MLCILAPSLGAQSENGDLYSVRLVQTALNEGSQGFVVSVVGKQLSRLGDGASIALLKILDDHDFANSRTVEGCLLVIRASFSSPQIVSNEIDRRPKVTLFLLKYAKENNSDPQVRKHVQETIEFVERSTRSGEPR
jgi:hypothetical protein